MKLILTTVALLVLAPLAAFSQTDGTCQGRICISQEAANRAAELARENPVLKEKIAVLEAALKAKDETIAELKATNEKNVADLKTALTKTETELSRVTGQLIATEAQMVRFTAIIDFMLKNGRIKKFGVINF